MPPRYLLDENLRGPLWRACRQHNARGQLPIDIVRVGDAACPALGSLDPEVLVWAEGAGRIVVTFDKSTLAAHLADHLRSGHLPRESSLFVADQAWHELSTFL
jgi:hypothetical protein